MDYEIWSFAPLPLGNFQAILPSARKNGKPTLVRQHNILAVFFKLIFHCIN